MQHPCNTRARRKIVCQASGSADVAKPWIAVEGVSRAMIGVKLLQLAGGTHIEGSPFELESEDDAVIGFNRPLPAASLPASSRLTQLSNGAQDNASDPWVEVLGLSPYGQEGVVAP